MAHHHVTTTPRAMPTRPAPKPTKPRAKECRCGCAPCRCEPCDLECFERPRFFCGQLLTDVELTEAQRYDIDKHRLHNRLLHGPGVVCGLRVQCDPRGDGHVTIAPGYAIDCCGNDIIVCETTSFDLLDSIRKYEIRKRGDGCLPPPEKPGPREYCLSLTYREHEAKPVTALVRCNGSTATRCEPSRIVEGFEIEVFERKEADERLPTFVERVRECYDTLQPSLVKFSQGETYLNLGTMTTTLAPEVARVRDRVRDAYNRLGIRCAIPREHLEVEWPREQPQAFRIAIPRAVFGATSLAGQLLLDCICEALLIECPECCDPRVVIACVRVDGQTFHICNTARRPVFGYLSAEQWGPGFMAYGGDPTRSGTLSSLLYVLARGGVGVEVARQPGSLPDLIERVCCGPGPLVRRPAEPPAFETANEMIGYVRQHAAYRASAIRMGLEGLARVAATGVPAQPREAADDLPVIHVFDKTPEAATAILRERGYTVVGTRDAAPEEGPAFLTGTAFTTAPPGASVELLTREGRVVGFTPRPEPAAPPEIGDLRARITTLEARIADVGVIADLRTKIADVDARLATMPTTVAPAEAVADVRGKLAEVEVRLAEEIAARTAVPPASARDLGELRTKLEIIESRVAAAGPQVEALRARLDEVAARPAIPPAEVAALTQRLGDLDARLGATAPEVADLRHRVRELDARVAALPPAASEFETVRSRVGELEARVNAVAPRFDEIRSRLAELDTRVAAAPAEIATVRGRVAEVEARVAVPPPEVMELLRKVGDLEERLRKIEQRRPPSGGPGRQPR